MTRVIWTRQAVEDVEAIRRYVARDSDLYARLLVDRLVAAVSRLEQFPHSGRVVPEIENVALREVIQDSYRLVYRLADKSIEVVTVFHAARLFRL